MSLTLLERLEEYRHDISLYGESSIDILADIEAAYLKVMGALNTKHNERPPVSTDNAVKYIRFIKRIRRLLVEFG